MVHLVDKESTVSSQQMNSIAENAQNVIKANMFAGNESGIIGLDANTSSSVQNMFSAHSIDSHCTISCMGVIPSIQAGSLKFTIKQFSEFDPEAMRGKLNAAHDANASATVTTIQAAADANKELKLVTGMEATKSEAVINSVADADARENKVFDFSTMMAAFEDYVTKCNSGDPIGVPVNYYIKSITKYELARLFIDKYYPDKFLNTVPYNPDETKGFA